MKNMFRRSRRNREVDSTEMKRLFSYIGLNENSIDDYTSEFAVTLSKVIKEASISGRCEESVGKLLYGVAKDFPRTALKHRPHLLNYIVSSKIKTKAQLDAALKFLSEFGSSKRLPIPEFDKACGVGLSEFEISTMIEHTVDELIMQSKNKKPTQLRDAALKVYPWADESVILDKIYEKLKEKTDADGGESGETYDDDGGPIMVSTRGLDGQGTHETEFIRLDIAELLTTSNRIGSTNVYLLPLMETVEDDPYFLMTIYTRADYGDGVTFIIKKFDLYVVGWIIWGKSTVNLLHIKDNMSRKFRSDQELKEEANVKLKICSLIQRFLPTVSSEDQEKVTIYYTGISVDYTSMVGMANVGDRSKVILGEKELKKAISNFVKSDKQKEWAKALLVVIQMLPETIRLRDMRDFVHSHYIHGLATEQHSAGNTQYLNNLQTNWSKMSRALLKWRQQQQQQQQPFTTLTINETIYDLQKTSQAVLVAKNCWKKLSNLD